MGKIVHAAEESATTPEKIEEKRTQKAHFSPDKQFDSI
jgi:hypothetical protein